MDVKEKGKRRDNKAHVLVVRYFHFYGTVYHDSSEQRFLSLVQPQKKIQIISRAQMKISGKLMKPSRVLYQSTIYVHRKYLDH